MDRCHSLLGLTLHPINPVWIGQFIHLDTKLKLYGQNVGSLWLDPWLCGQYQGVLHWVHLTHMVVPLATYL